MLILLLLFYSLYGIAQKKKITGLVKNQQNEVLESVSVRIPERNIITQTDKLGQYHIDVNPRDKIVFNMLGYKELVLEYTEDFNSMIELQAIEGSLEEVVVIGYGSQSKKLVTGAVTKVNMEDTKDLPNTNFTQALRGRVAGVQFTDNGRPGQSGSFLVRGPRSLSANNSPLIILDGTFFNGAFIDINPNDIASMEILKDASASAIYGSKAANGVILITSKKGILGDPKVAVSAFYGTSDWSSRPKLLSPERYVQKSIDIRKQNNVTVDPDDPSTYLTITEAENYANGISRDPYDMISQKAFTYSADINISGRTNKTNYFTSASYMKEHGLVNNDNLNRISLRSNIENKVKEWLTVGLNSMYSKNDLSGIEADITMAQRISPFGNWHNEDGSVTQYAVPEDEGVSQNPLWRVYNQDNLYIRENLMANFYGIIQIPKIKGLSYRLNYSHNYRWIRDYNFIKQNPNITSNNTSASKVNWRGDEWVLENILDYKVKFGTDHGLNVTLLYGANEENQDRATIEAIQLATDQFGWDKLELGSTYNPTSYASRVSGISSMARINYRFRDRYLLTLTARRDGSSVFASNNKYGTFPSAAFAWVASDEAFIKKVEAIDFLKFRLSYGAVGNQSITPYQSLSLASLDQYVYGDGGTTSIGIFDSNIANRNLKWETTYSANFGLDFAVLKNRLSGTIEYYNMDTRDLLVERTLPIMTGYFSTWTNLGLIRNKGVELTLNSVNIKTDKFEWSSTFVFSKNQNEIVKLYGADNDGDGREDDDVGNRWFIGQPINVLYSYVFDGIYQQEDEIPSGFQIGYERYKDLNDDGITNDLNNDRAILGQTGEPKYRWGFTNNFNYGNISLSVFINAMQGWIGNLGQFYANSLNPLRPANSYDLGWWNEENRSNERSALTSNNSVQTIDRSFIRLQDVSLSYNFSNTVINKLNLSSLNVFASGKNLWTSTEWKGTNPETNTVYPLSRVYSLGFKIGF